MLPNNLFLVTVKTSSQRRKKIGRKQEYGRHMAKRNVVLPHISYVDIGKKVNNLTTEISLLYLITCKKSHKFTSKVLRLGEWFKI